MKKSRRFARPVDRTAWQSFALSLGLIALSLALPAVFAGSWSVLIVGSIIYAIGALRLTSIQHDCGHYSYFTSRPLNDLVGRWLSLVSGIAYIVLRHNHNLHHAHLGDLSHRDSHEVFTMTAGEYEQSSQWTRLNYRAYRNPFMLLLIGPIIIFFLRYRWPRNAAKVSVYAVIEQNVAMFAFWGLTIYALGWWSFGAIIFGSYIAGSIGILIVYLGHNFETTYWALSEDKNVSQAALQGSSVLDMGIVVDFCLLNLGYHDLHHLNAKIPCYHLKKCHLAMTEGLNHSKISLWDALRCFRWRLWDENSKRMVPFSHSLLQELRA